MSGEPAAPASEPSAPAPASSELQPGAPAPVDGGAAPVDANATPTPEPQPAAETPEEQTKKRERFDRRFSDLSRAAREAELRAARLEGELSALRNQQRQPEPQAPEAQAATAPAPDPANYKGGEYDLQYLKDVAKWEGKEAVREALAEDARQRADAERAHAVNAAIREGQSRLENTLAAAQAEAAASEHFENAPRILDLAYVPLAQGGLPRHVVDLITESDNPVHIAEVLGRQPERLRELRAQTPMKAARTIAMLDAAIAANLKRQAPANGGAPAPKPAPKPSPAPIPTVTPTGAAPSQNPERMSFAEFQAYAQNLREARARENGAA